MFPLLLNSTNTNRKQAFYTQHLGPFLSPNNNVRLNLFNPHLIFKTTRSIIATFINIHLVSKWLNGFPQTTLEGNCGVVILIYILALEIALISTTQFIIESFLQRQYRGVL